MQSLNTARSGDRDLLQDCVEEARIVDDADGRGQIKGQYLGQHAAVSALEIGGDVGEPEERLGRRSRRRAEEVDVAESIVAAGAYDEVRRVRRQKP